MTTTRILGLGQGNSFRFVTPSSALQNFFRISKASSTEINNAVFMEDVGKTHLRCQDHCLGLPSPCCGEAR